MSVASLLGYTVLYVEDEETDRFLMQRAFIKEGCSASLMMVDSGEEAVSYLAGTAVYADRSNYPVPALVLLDLNLGPVSGLEVLQWIRAQPNYRVLPVVVYSSSMREEDHRQAQVLGANAFVTKPHSPSRISEVIQLLKERWLHGTAASTGVAWAGVISPDGKEKLRLRT